MSRENGDSHGLWPADDQVVPLSSLSATVAPSPNGDRAASALDEERRDRQAALPASSRPSACCRPSPDVPSGGWRRVVFSLSGGRVAIGTEPGRTAPARARREGQDADRRLPQDRVHLPQGRRRQDDHVPARRAHVRDAPR